MHLAPQDQEKKTTGPWKKRGACSVVCDPPTAWGRESRVSELASGSFQPVDVGLLLPVSQSSAVRQVGSAVSLPGRILSLWKSHGIRKKPRLRI